MALVVGKIQQVLSRWIKQPGGRGDQGWPVDVAVEFRVSLGADNRSIVKVMEGKHSISRLISFDVL